MNEPKWKTHRVTMPEDRALEYLDKLLVVVNKQFLDPGYPIALSMAIDKMRAPLPDNKALTVEELREMDGELAASENICTPYCQSRSRCKHYENCTECKRDWLTQPAEED